jgi:hypothetical protein
MADTVKFLYGEQTTPTVNGVNLPTRTIVKYEEDSSGTVTSSEIYVYYSAIPGGRDSAGNTFGGGTPTSTSNFDPGGYSIAAYSNDGGKTFRTLNYRSENSLPPGAKVGDPILGAAAIASLNTPGSPYYEAVQNQVINASVNTRSGLAPQLASSLQTSTPTDPNLDQNPIATGPNSENPNANIDPQALTGLGSQLENFDTTNTFGALKESFLKYPTSIDNGQDRIMITQIEYVPSGITAANTNINQISELLGNRDSQLTKSLGMVVLPMPNDISETNQTAWGESSLSTIAAALMNPAARAAQGLATANPGESIDAVRGLGETLFSGQTKNRLNQFLTTNAAASLIKLGGINVDPEAYLNRVTGVAINPNLELLFNGPKLRQFGFSFKMTPRSADEARNIRSIVKFFKKGMAPRRSTVAEKSIYLGTPNVFKLKFVTGADKDIEGIGRIKTCALVSCTVNYTPDGFYAAYDGPNGSQPIATVMQLAFTELTPVYNDEYDAEGDGAENSIGPEGSEYKITGSSESPTPSSGIGLPNDLANGLPGIGLPGINPGGR